MGQRVIADNWSLQAVSELLVNGLDQDDNPGISPLTDPHKPPAPLPQAVIDIEALFDLLTDVVLRDQILVDDQFHDARFGKGEPLAELTQRSIVRPHEFLKHPERLEAPRREFLSRLLLNDVMLNEHSANEAAWNDTRTTPHRFTSQLVWGGAGMLARAWVYEAPYTPHPLRRRLFQRAGVIVPSPPTALDELKGELARHRDALYPASVGDDGLKTQHHSLLKGQNVQLLTSGGLQTVVATVVATRVGNWLVQVFPQGHEKTAFRRFFLPSRLANLMTTARSEW